MAEDTALRDALQIHPVGKKEPGRTAPPMTNSSGDAGADPAQKAIPIALPIAARLKTEQAKSALDFKPFNAVRHPIKDGAKEIP